MIIRYANCWEDVDILLEGLNPLPNAKILSVASGGDNSFSLLTTNPKNVVCADINPIQLYLMALKQACFRVLDYDEILKFLGFQTCENRILIFEKLKNAFTYPNAYNFWLQNIHLIQKGIIYQGKFEKYFQLFSKKVLPFIHSKKTIYGLLAEKNEQEQITFYEKKWNTFLWRMMFKVFFSKYIMGKYGRDKQFFNQVKVPVATYVYEKTAKYLKNTLSQKNWILHFNLLGHFGEFLPHYLLPENVEIIKKNIEKIILFEGKVEDAIPIFGKFDAFNLSNIFEYMPENVFLDTAKALSKGAEHNAKFAYWNLMVPRVMSDISSDILPQDFLYEKEISQKLNAVDKGFFYNKFIVEKKNS